MSRRGLCLGALLWSLASCEGGPWGYEPDVDSLPPDEVEPTYPVGPYGSAVGDVIGDITFDTAFYDPFTTCKDPAHWELGGEGPRALTLGDLHRGNPYCPNHGKNKKKKLLLVTTFPT